MKNIIYAGCLLLALMGMGGLANATVLTFDNAGWTGCLSGGFSYDECSYTQDGYTLSAAAGFHTDAFGDEDVYWHTGGDNPSGDNILTLTYAGGLFDLISLDYIEGIFSVDSNTGMSALVGSALDATFGWTGLSSVTFTVSNFNQTDFGVFDNLAVRAADIPEVSPLALMAMGLLGLVGLRCKRRA